MKKNVLLGFSLLMAGTVLISSCDADKKDDKSSDNKEMSVCGCIESISKTKTEEELDAMLKKCDQLLDNATMEEVEACPAYETALAVIDSYGHDHDDHEEWVELEEFHSYMAATFHPADEGDVAPLKEKARAMADAAKVLENSTIPGHYGDNAKEILKRLREGSEALAKKVEEGKASDEELTSDIIALHEVFHEVHGACTHNHDH